MKSLFRFFILWLLLAAMTPGDKPLPNALLWKLSGNGLKEPSYILGTIHALCQTDSLPVSDLEAHVKETKRIYLELDMDDPMLQMTMLGKLRMKDTTLRDLYTEEEYQRLSKYFQDSIGQSLSLFDGFKPFMLTSMLIMEMMPCGMDAVENRLLKISKSANMKVYGLETVDEQMAVMDKMSLKEQAQQVLEMVKEYDSSVNEFTKLRQAYLRQDLHAMDSLMKTLDNEMAGFSEALINERNKKWIPRITKIANESPTFFAVGAGHLAGEQGIIRLLRIEGYTVEPVR